MQWATYYDAADQIGISRIWGGIHPPADDFGGRFVGAQAGQEVWSLVQKYWDGSLLNTPVTLSVKQLDVGSCEIRANTLRGIYYRLQSTEDISLPFTNEPGPAMLALDGWLTITNNSGSTQKFFRVAASLSP
jgi:hypothetical protein